MPMLSRNLERAVRRALSIAATRQHEYATLEHLLLLYLYSNQLPKDLQPGPGDVVREADETVRLATPEIDKVTRASAEGVAGVVRGLVFAAGFTRTVIFVPSRRKLTSTGLKSS